MKGLPNWYYFTDMTLHSSGQPPLSAPGLIDPQGIAWIEWGGIETQMTEWLGSPASNLPFRFNGKALGMYSFALKTDKGDIVTRRKAHHEA